MADRTPRWATRLDAVLRDELQEGEEIVAAARGAAPGVVATNVAAVVLGGLIGGYLATLAGFEEYRTVYTLGGIVFGGWLAIVINRRRHARQSGPMAASQPLVVITDSRLLVAERGTLGGFRELVAEMPISSVRSFEVGEGPGLLRTGTFTFVDGTRYDVRFPRLENPQPIADAVRSR